MILFDGEDISSDASLVLYIYIYSTNIPPFFPWFLLKKTMCPEVDSASENEYQGFLLG